MRSRLHSFRRTCRLCLLVFSVAAANVFLHNPRGSNNKLNENENNVRNPNRLFNSQNNDAGGYHVGDNCKPNCHEDDNNFRYSKGKHGAGQGILTHYTGSQLYIEWSQKHGCGAGHPNVNCQIVLQYMCDSDNERIADGTDTGELSGTGTAESDSDKGEHEPEQYYKDCKTRHRNKGLYTADQYLWSMSAITTRQHGHNLQYGYECPEERDYYPYWHPTPWHDIAVITSEPETRCDYYRRESQNVKPRGACYKKPVGGLPRRTSEHNNNVACNAAGDEWDVVKPHGEPPPECLGDVQSRDNQNGNNRNGKPTHYIWTIPRHILKDGKEEAKCVLRLRYNITTGDFQKHAKDYFFVDSNFNGNFRQDPTLKGPFTYSNPVYDVLGFEKHKAVSDKHDYFLQLQIKLQNVGRTFQDRTHIFRVRDRPHNVPASARIVNYNVRGRRGNIVQVYPSVEYDFVPIELTVEAGTYLHFQWTGSDAGDQGNEGNGRRNTDRSNLVQLADLESNVPIPLTEHTLLVDMTKFGDDVDLSNGDFAEGVDLVKKFAFLDQYEGNACGAQPIPVPMGANEAVENSIHNCRQLNAAPAYFDGGLVKMQHIGVHHIASTRNNDFSNRSQKATIIVVRSGVSGAMLAGIAVGSICLLLCRWNCFVACRTGHREQREQLNQDVEMEMSCRRSLRALMTTDAVAAETQVQPSWRQKFRDAWEAGELHTRAYLMLNVIVFNIGFWLHYGWGANNIAHPFVKGSGFTLELNLSMLVLPSLTSLLFPSRGRPGRLTLGTIDDPISFHGLVAALIFCGSLVHIAAHVYFMRSSAEVQSGGTSFIKQVLAGPRLVQYTGIIIALMLSLVVVAEMSCVRRGSSSLARAASGSKFISFSQSTWPAIYFLLFVHAPARLWIWLFFPMIIMVVDKGMGPHDPQAEPQGELQTEPQTEPPGELQTKPQTEPQTELQSQKQITCAVLKMAKLLPCDVLNLTFDLPDGFTYQSGQYVHVGWRGEWHPFTITSAPEECKLSLHMRSLDALDWCSALSRYLCYEVPDAAGIKTVNFPPRPHTCIKFAKCLDMQSGKVYSRPDTGTSTTQRTIGIEDVDRAFCSGEVPGDAVELQLSGPCGAQAQICWEYDTILVVGYGHGVLPFISIARSFQERIRLRMGMGDDTAGQKGSTKRSMRTRAGGMKTREEIAAEILPVPCKIYFVWIVPSLDEARWFYDVLLKAITGPAHTFIDVRIHVTGEKELSNLECFQWVDCFFPGHPSWARIFQDVKEQCPHDHVGVFLCGSTDIGHSLATQSLAFTDPPSVDGCKFFFHSESFWA